MRPPGNLSLVSSVGGVVMQPGLGKAADLRGYPESFVLAGLLQALALPFLALARRRAPVSEPHLDRVMASRA